jgi:predicted transcriptional regulator
VKDDITTVKEKARRLLERLPDEPSWDDFMYEICMQEKIAAGLKAAEEGRFIPHEKVRQELAPASGWPDRSQSR